MKTLIVDDIKEARKALHHDLIDYCEELQVIGEADSKATAIQKIESLQPELVFLDIDLGDGTGFDVLQAISYQPKVIFTTAFDEYAIKAFKFGAIDYLLKPIDDEELVNAVKKAKTISSEKATIATSYNNSQPPQKIVIHTQEESIIINLEDLICCEASSNYTIFHLQNKQIVSSETLKHYDELLSQNDFYRSHHSFLVNLQQVKTFVKTDGGYLEMNSGKQVPVSMRKRDGLQKALKEKFLQ